MDSADSLPDAKRNHLWRGTVWQTDPELHPLGPRHSAEVYCCEESNGYAVWYVRKLPHADQRAAAGIDNGDYLLEYFGRHQRDDAITSAVLAANGAASPELQIAALDALAKGSSARKV
ncbi:MAG: hypothetical protein H7327_10015 [Herminiimonas sp.]|nr:hypothetical protein [Herminiimonas sp.]